MAAPSSCDMRATITPTASRHSRGDTTAPRSARRATVRMGTETVGTRIRGVDCREAVLGVGTQLGDTNAGRVEAIVSALLLTVRAAHLAVRELVTVALAEQMWRWRIGVEPDPSTLDSGRTRQRDRTRLPTSIGRCRGKGGVAPVPALETNFNDDELRDSVSGGHLDLHRNLHIESLSIYLQDVPTRSMSRRRRKLSSVSTSTVSTPRTSPSGGSMSELVREKSVR